MEVRSAATAAVEPTAVAATAAVEPTAVAAATPPPVDDKAAATCGCCYLITAFISCFTG
jgi:hypothetical protein